MANFHTDFLVIAADANDMVKALTTIAENLSSSGMTHRAYDISSKMDPAFAFSEVAGDIDAWYWFIFPDGGSERSLSETANVRLYRAGKHYVLTIHYSTAWVSNVDDVFELVESFPAGNYGVAFLDSDEGEDFDLTNFVFTTVSGAGKRQGASADDTMNYVQLMRYAAPYWREDLSKEADLGKIAFAFATFYWPESGPWRYPDSSIAVGKDPRAEASMNLSDHEMWTGREDFRHIKVQGEAKKRRAKLDKEQLVTHALDVVEQLPLSVAALDRIDRIEASVDSLVPGMTLSLHGEWWDGTIGEYEWYDYRERGISSKLWVLNPDGSPLDSVEELNYEGEWKRLSEEEADSLVLLAPYMMAIVERASFRSHLTESSGSGSWPLVVRLEMKPANLEKLVVGLRARFDAFTGSVDEDLSDSANVTGGASW